MDEPIDLREPHGTLGDDGAMEILVQALGEQPATAAQLPTDPTPAVTCTQATEPAQAAPPGAEFSNMEPAAVATNPATPLKRLDSLPRSIRRRMDVCFGEGEQVECAILGRREGRTRWVLGTTHRIVVAPSEPREPGDAALTLPYHRTTAWVSETGTVELHSTEFDRIRSAVIDPEAGYQAELLHLLDRIAEA